MRSGLRLTCAGMRDEQKAQFHVPPSFPGEPEEKGPAPHAASKPQVNFSLDAPQVALRGFWLTP